MVRQMKTVKELVRNWRRWARIQLGASALAVFGVLPGFGSEASRPPVTIGNGSGHLSCLDVRAVPKLQPGATLEIRAGIYSGLSLGNLSGSPNAPITVVCDPNTVFTTSSPQPNEFTNIAYVRFENFPLENYKSVCLHITARSHDLLLKNFYITNASGYCFHNNLVFRTLEPAGLEGTMSFMRAAASPAIDAASGRVGYNTTDHSGRERYAGATADAGAAENQDVARRRVPPAAGTKKPLFKDFMGLNGHFTFEPELYRQVCGLARNYHSLNWDVKQPGNPITLPVCVNHVNWNNDVYGRWQKVGFETDICIQLGGFQADSPDYRRFWAGREDWCYDYGKALAVCFGPSGQGKQCTSIEIGNEPGVKFDRALFKSIFKQMALGIRDGDARIKILTPAVQARPADDYSQDLRDLYAEKDILPLYDVINLHTYASVERKNTSESPWNRSFPEDPAIAYLKVVDEAITWRDAHAPGKELWVTEFGYDACTPEAMKRRGGWFLNLDWQGVTDLQQAQYLVRSLLAFAERDVQRAYIYYYDDDDSPSVHGCAGLTRKFVPKMSFWAVRQLYQLLGDCRFKRVVQKDFNDVFVFEFESGDTPARVIWVVWSPTGARTNEKEHYTPRQVRATLHGLPSLPVQVLGMATAEGEAPQPVWENAGPSAVTLTVSENPAYIVMKPSTLGPGR